MPPKPSKAPLLIGIAIPVLMVLFVAGSIYLPRLFAAGPEHDFLYAVARQSGGSYAYYYGYGASLEPYFAVRDERLARADFPAYDAARDYTKSQAVQRLYEVLPLLTPRTETTEEASRAAYDAQKRDFLEQQARIEFYRHDVNTNESRTIAFADAATLTLDAAVLSRDGFQIFQGSSGGFELFFLGGVNDQRYLIRGTNGFVERLNLPPAFSYIQFVGWVTN